MSYLLMVSYGRGRRYIEGREISRLLTAVKAARDMAILLNDRNSPKAPRATVTVLRKVSEHG